MLMAAVFVLTTNARAEGPRVVLIHGGAGDPLTTHLIDELVSIGFAVEIVPAGDYEFAALAEVRNARAIVRVGPSRRTIHLWTEGKSAPIRIEEGQTEKGDSATLSLRAVEELRGQLLTAEMSLPDPDRSLDKPPASAPNEAPHLSPYSTDAKPVVTPVRPISPAKPRLRDEVPIRSGQLWLHVAPVAMMHPRSGGMTASAAAMLGVRWMGSPRFGADLAALVPVIPASVSSTAGNVQIAASALLAGGWVELFRPLSTLTIGAGAGVGGGLFNHYGQPKTAGIEVQDGTVAYFLPYLRSAVSWSMTPNVSLRADFLGAIATPRPVLRLPGRPTDIYFGQPLITLGLGLDVKLR